MRGGLTAGIRHDVQIAAMLKAARDFGLDPVVAAELAISARSIEHLATALATALVERGAVVVPSSPA